MDIVIDDATLEWDGRTRFLADGEASRVHVEVGAYAAWDENKVREDLDSLHRSIADAAQVGKKSWTALVLIGGEWKGAPSKIGPFLHGYYHGRKLARAIGVAPPYDYSWPYVDAVIVPGLYLQKHDLFEADEGGHTPPSRDQLSAWPAWPFLFEYPLSPVDSLLRERPLAVARAFLYRYLRNISTQVEHTDLWSSAAEERDVMGPEVDRTVYLDWNKRSHALCLQDGAPGRLHHWAHKIWAWYVRDGAERCGLERPYRFAPSVLDDYWRRAPPISRQ